MEGAGEVHTECWWGNQRNERIGRLKRAWEDNIQMEILKNGLGRGCEMDCCGSEQEQVAGSCEKSDEPLLSLKRGVFEDQLRKCFVDQLRNY
jgi:hypothetical protein